MHSSAGEALGRPDGTGGWDAPGSRAWSEDPQNAYRQLFEATDGLPVPDDEPPAPRSRRRRRRLQVAALVVLLLVLGAAGGGLAYAAHARKQPALKALRAGNTQFEPVAGQLRSASDVEELTAVAGGADAAADRVQRAARPVAQPRTDLERMVRQVLRDEQAVLRAAAGAADLRVENLGDWPATRDALASAEADLGSSVKRLAAAEPDLAPTLVTGRAIASHSDDVVADFASTSMTDLLSTRLVELGNARTTADLRAVAARAATASQAVGLALGGVDAEGPQGARITAVGAALKALTGLRAVTGDKLTAWAPVRTQLVAATGSLPGVDTDALASVDGLVTGAQRRLAAWRAATAKAVARNTKDGQALTTYATAVQAALTSQVAADQADAAFVTGVGKNPLLTSQQAVAYLDGAAKTRAAITAALTAATPPKALTTQHDALVALAEQASQTVTSGYQGTKKTKCGKIAPTVPGGKPTPAPCYYGATGGWVAFSTTSAKATTTLTPVRTAWAKAVTVARKELAARKLPVKPVV